MKKLEFNKRANEVLADTQKELEHRPVGHSVLLDPVTAAKVHYFLKFRGLKNLEEFILTIADEAFDGCIVDELAKEKFERENSKVRSKLQELGGELNTLLNRIFNDEN